MKLTPHHFGVMSLMLLSHNEFPVSYEADEPTIEELRHAGYATTDAATKRHRLTADGEAAIRAHLLATNDVNQGDYFPTELAKGQVLPLAG